VLSMPNKLFAFIGCSNSAGKETRR